MGITPPAGDDDPATARCEHTRGFRIESAGKAQDALFHQFLRRGFSLVRQDSQQPPPLKVVTHPDAERLAQSAQRHVQQASSGTSVLRHQSPLKNAGLYPSPHTPTGRRGSSRQAPNLQVVGYSARLLSSAVRRISGEGSTPYCGANSSARLN